MKNNKKNSRDFFCENCGSHVSANAKKCPNCGKEFVAVRCPKCYFSGKQELFTGGCPVCGYSAPASGEAGETVPGAYVPPVGAGVGDGIASGEDRGAKLSETARRWLFRLFGLFLIGSVILILVLYLRL